MSRSLLARALTAWGRRVMAARRHQAPDVVIGGADNPYLLRWWVTPWSRIARQPLGIPPGAAAPLRSRLAWRLHVARVKALRLLPGVYLHWFLRSDDDRALHDHPWASCSVILRGRYVEHTIAAGGIEGREVLEEGAVRVRWSGAFAHRVELLEGESAWTLFLTGPQYRAWGFHCPKVGWIPWERFTSPARPGEVGKGCEG